MKAPTKARARRLDEPVAEGAPVLAVLDEDREPIEDLVAELLLAAIEREAAEASQ